MYASLDGRFKGDLLRPGEWGYEDVRSVWNGVVSRSPRLIARCADVADVQLAVKMASATGILTAIRCGGHSLAGFSTCDGLVIDLSRMREVALDSDNRRARISGGCLLGSIDSATQKAGLVFPSGVVSHTGASGLILGGGTGWLTRRFGLSCDNVEGFTMVAADGSLVHCSESENPDLFWALRGGGGNFGVVTEFELRLHPLTSVVLGEGLAPERDIPQVLDGRRYYMKSGYFADLDDSTIDSLAAAASEIPSPDTQIELAYLGAAAAQVPATETAFGDRSAPVIVNLLANWAEPALDAANLSWVRQLFHKLRPAMKPGVYVNFMSADEQDRVPEAYHQRWERIVKVKLHYDPTNFFRLNQNVPPKKTIPVQRAADK
jgi:FAD/FMN-containing dehydrogenase